jgi:hypothetical protein
VAAGVRWDVPVIGHDVWSFFLVEHRVQRLAFVTVVEIITGQPAVGH